MRRGLVVMCVWAVALACSGRGAKSVPPSPEPRAPAPAPAPTPASTPAPPPGPAYYLVTFAEVADAIAARCAALIARGESLPPSEIGYYLDVQEARFRQVATSGVRVVRLENRVLLNLPGQLTFEVGSAKLSSSAGLALDRVARVLVEFRFSVVSLHGHTDASGDARQNVLLSEQRALAVAQHLIAAGVAADRIVVAGYGASSPVASNDTAGGREQNRRVELQIDPLAE